MIVFTGQAKQSVPPRSPSWSKGPKQQGASQFCWHVSFLPYPNPWISGLFAYFLTSKCRRIHERSWQMVEVQWKPTWASCSNPSCPWQPWVVFGGGNCSCCCFHDRGTVHLQRLRWKVVTEHLAQWTTSQAAFSRKYYTKLMTKMWPLIYHLMQKYWIVAAVVKRKLLTRVQWLLLKDIHWPSIP